MKTLLPLLALAAFLPAQDPGLKQRLARLSDRFEEQRVLHHIPGLALAVVLDDKVVLAKGFGVADLESGKPVRVDTTFAIGSTTKAFTSTMIGMLGTAREGSWLLCCVLISQTSTQS